MIYNEFDEVDFGNLDEVEKEKLNLMFEKINIVFRDDFNEDFWK